MATDITEPAVAIENQPANISRFRAVSLTRSYEYVVRQIEEEIRNGHFAKGARLPTERELGAAFGVSRGVIREAIKVLSAMGLVESRQGSGIYVRNNPTPMISRALTLSVSHDEESLEQLFEFRRELEKVSVALAATRRSDEHLHALHEAADETAIAAANNDWERFAASDVRFHAVLAEAAGNTYLAVVVGSAREMQRDVVALIVHTPGSMGTAAEHHRQIVAALEARDAERARAIIDEHIIYTAGAVDEAMRKRA